MDIRKKLFKSKSNTTIVISHSSVVVYDTTNDAFEAKLTLRLDRPLKSLYQLLESRNDKNIRIILEPQGENHQILSIPDLGTSKTKVRFKAMLEEMPYEMINYTATHKPTSKTPEWKFLISGAHLNQITKHILNTLANHSHLNLEVFSASAGYFNICFKLQSIVSQRLKAPHKSYFLIYIRNSNNELYEFLFKDKKLINISSMKSENSTLAKTINERFNKHKRKLILENVSIDRVFLIGLLPEPLRANIAIGKNRLFFSPAEIFYTFTKKPQPLSASYSSAMLEITHINSYNSNAEIVDIKPHTLLETLKNLWSVLASGIITVSATCILFMVLMCYKSNITLHKLMKDAINLDNEQEKEFVHYKTKQEILKQNAQVNELYQVILSSHYSLEMLSKISQANKYKLPIQRLVYNTNNNSEIDIILSNAASDRTFFENLDYFVKELSLNLPSQNIIVRQVMNPTNKMQDQESHIAISIKNSND